MRRERPRGRGHAGGGARLHVGPDIDHYFGPPPVLEPQVVLQPARPVLPPPVLQPILPPPVLPHPIPTRFSQQRIETYLSDMPPPVLQPTLRQSVLPRPIPARFAQQRIETYLSDTESEAGHSGIISLYDVRALKNVLT
jgi:hypothetical protein